MKLLNELLNLTEANQGTTLIGLTIDGALITDKTKNEKWRGDFHCSDLEITSLEGAPKEIIYGDFSCLRNGNLVSLKGSPKKVDGYFKCTHNPELKSLEGGPKEVTGVYQISSNINLTSLKGAPKKINSDFYCAYNSELVSFEGAPEEVTGDFLCYNNQKLTSLKGAPAKITKDFYCAGHKNLTSIEGAPKEIGGDFICRDNNITSLKGIHKQVTKLSGKFNAEKTPIKSHVLGLLLNGCTGVEEFGNKEVQKILNKYLPNTRGNKGLIECQSELLDAGLEDFAEL